MMFDNRDSQVQTLDKHAVIRSMMYCLQCGEKIYFRHRVDYSTMTIIETIMCVKTTCTHGHRQVLNNLH